jgi:hypothetical protein
VIAGGAIYLALTRMGTPDSEAPTSEEYPEKHTILSGATSQQVEH